MFVSGKLIPPVPIQTANKQHNHLKREMMARSDREGEKVLAVGDILTPQSFESTGRQRGLSRVTEL